MESSAQHIKTPSSDEAITIDDFISIRDILKDSNRYFQNHIDVKNDDDDTRTSIEDYDHLECLYERTSNALKSVDDLIHKFRMNDNSQNIFGLMQNNNRNNNSPGEQIENTSYLDMSRKKYESIQLTTKNTAENLNRHDYVDVISKPLHEDFNDDDNIYDNYVVERNHSKTDASGKFTPFQRNRTGSDSVKEDTTISGQKSDCPFNGLPAAHLTIMHSPKVGWLTMHLRGKRFIHHFGVHFKRKYYTGIVMKQTEQAPCEWWLLMYAGGTNDLKPSVCLPLNRFSVHANRSNAAKSDYRHQRQECEPNKSNPCKFELNEKTNRKTKKSYCFVADTPEHCEHWVNLLKQLSIGLPYVESTFLMTAQIRKLPMLPSNAKNIDIDRQCNDLNGVNNRIDLSSDDICNHSEGVYEEPEDYYRNVQNYSTTTTATLPILPQKMLTQSSASQIHVGNVHIAEIYDTPRKPIRKSDGNYDQISLESTSPTHGRKTVNANDEICTKQSLTTTTITTKLKDQSGRMANDDESPVSSKYHMSTVRKWLFSNHFSKLRQSSNSTNSERASSDDGATVGSIQSINSPPPSQQQQQSQCSKSTTNAPPTDGQRRTFNVQPTKFNKVHMIINQLEANGQLTLISGGNTSTKV